MVAREAALMTLVRAIAATAAGPPATRPPRAACALTAAGTGSDPMTW